VADNPFSLHDHVLHVRVTVEPPSSNSHNNIRHLPSCVPARDDVNQEACVAGGGGVVFVAAGVPPPLQTQAPDLAEDTYCVILELLHHPQPGGARGLLHLLQLGDVPLHGCKRRDHP
jgi:hypothetical protein